MPELAEVDFFRRCWDVGVGKEVERVEIHAGARIFRGCDMDRLVSELPGHSLRASHTHGKQMLFEFAGGLWLGVHLGMTGELRAEAADYPAGRHDHLALRQKERTLVFADARMFGRVRFDETGGGPPAWWRALPPALLDAAFTEAHLASCLSRRARSPLKAVLLDQGIFPGVGNWMADEILWRLHWHPLTPVGALSPAQRGELWREVRWLAEKALATIGVDWSDPPREWLYSHRWATGNPCPRCHRPLAREEAAGRTTCWCPACQPWPEMLADRLPLPAKPRRTGHRRETPFHSHPKPPRPAR